MRKLYQLLNQRNKKKKQDAIKEEKEISIFDKKESNDNKKEIEQPLILNQQVEKEIKQPLVLNQQVKEEKKQPVILNQDIPENKESFQDKNLSNE